MSSPADQKFLFIHVMKTGGTSFADIIGANFSVSQLYPDACMPADMDIFGRMEAYLFVPGLVTDVNALNGQLRMVRGHVPYAVRSLLDDNYIAMTLLRDPIDRTLSYLKHCRRYHIEHMNKSLEQIYEDAWFHASFISNYQTKIFSMSAQEALAENRFLPGKNKLPPRRELEDGQSLSSEVQVLRDSAPGRFSLEMFAASTGVISIDESRLAVARKNLVSVDVVGVTEHYDRFLQRLAARYGWQIKAIPYRHVGEMDVISPEFRNRIAIDNAFDVELYEYAKELST